MKISNKEFKFVSTPEKGEVTAAYDQPESAKALLVLGHGSGSNLRHSLMETLSEALNEQLIATFRFNYPYSERGKGGMDGEKVRLSTVRSAINVAQKDNEALPIFAGGHSMSGRMFSMAQANAPIEKLAGIIFYAFPLYSSNPSIERAEHLKKINLPMLFLSGQRDKMANLDLLELVVSGLTRSSLHVVDTADHGFKVLKRRKTEEAVMSELARVTSQWIGEILG